MNNMKKHSERGAIMLEVIAVLSLMGLMGAMLFRQIYKRNQELQNIQMASEIRVVKEAFSAYIQANGAEISCPNLSVAMAPQHCEVPGKTLAEVVKDYLPTGFLPSAGEGWGADTVEQLAGGSVTLWFASGGMENWDAANLTYTDGDNSVTVSGVTAVALKFGDDGSEQYANLAAMGAFDAFTSRKIFESAGSGLLA